jgi:hypothetical protein
MFGQAQPVMLNGEYVQPLMLEGKYVGARDAQGRYVGRGLVVPSGMKYDGDFLDGLFHGEGVLTYENSTTKAGVTYTGAFHRGV